MNRGNVFPHAFSVFFPPAEIRTLSPAIGSRARRFISIVSFPNRLASVCPEAFSLFLFARFFHSSLLPPPPFFGVKIRSLSKMPVSLVSDLAFQILGRMNVSGRKCSSLFVPISFGPFSFLPYLSQRECFLYPCPQFTLFLFSTTQSVVICQYGL